MAGELTTGTISIVDASDPVAIAAAIDAIVLAAVTDTLHVIRGNGNKILIFKVQRTA